jgi:sec-independent protein translocase protein TatA
MGSLSPVHWLLVIVVALLLFGPGRLAGVGKGLGEGIKSFKKGLNEDEADDKGPQPQLSEKKTEDEKKRDDVKKQANEA